MKKCTEFLVLKYLLSLGPALLFLHFSACKPEAEGVPKFPLSKTFEGKLSPAANNRSDTTNLSDTIWVGPYLSYALKNNLDTGFLMQVRTEEIKVRDSIRAFSRSGIRIYLNNGTYNPAFVEGVNSIIDSSTLPGFSKANIRKMLLSIPAPSRN